MQAGMQAQINSRRKNTELSATGGAGGGAGAWRGVSFEADDPPPNGPPKHRRGLSASGERPMMDLGLLAAINEGVTGRVERKKTTLVAAGGVLGFGGDAIDGATDDASPDDAPAPAAPARGSGPPAAAASAVDRGLVAAMQGAVDGGGS